MKTPLKPILWLAGGIAIIAAMFLGSLALQLYRNAALLQKFSADNLAALEQREQQYAENIFAAAETGVKGSLERGEMDKFVVLLRSQKEVKGLQEFTLFDRNGVSVYSSDAALLNRRLPPELRDQLLAGSASLTRCTNGSFEVYRSQPIQTDCLRCHIDWKEGGSSGVLLGRFSTESLVASRQQWSESTSAMKHSQIAGGLWSTLAIVIVFGAATAAVVYSKMIAPLARIHVNLTGTSENLRATAGQLGSGSQSLAQGASQQAASLEETSAALEEFSATTKNNAGHAQAANELATQMSRAAEVGAAGILQLNGAMNEIQGASSNIAKIIKTIDEIAFQTNLLALNAAVEAARAGNAGLGFAVVAEEVRSLARRSAEAAKETSGIIEDCVLKSKNGLLVSAEVSRHVQAITEQARRLDEIVAQIANASQEQSRGISELNIAVRDLDGVTQTNAANSEEIASVAVELNSEAERLRLDIAGLSRLLSGKSETAKAESPEPGGLNGKTCAEHSTLAGSRRPPNQASDFPLPKPRR
jgi:methyl-accepting chemotaxis protein